MTTPLESKSYPKDPTMPAAAPTGYVTPTAPANPSKFEPPLTAAEIDTRRIQFYELILKQVVQALTGFFLPGSSATSQLGSFAASIPVIGPLVQSITGVVGGTLSTITNMFTNLLGIGGGGGGGFLGFNANAPSGSFNPLSAAVGFISNILNLSTTFGGLFTGGLIPGLDGSKLVSGVIAPGISGVQAVNDGLVNGFLVGKGGAPGSGWSTTDVFNQSQAVTASGLLTSDQLSALGNGLKQTTGTSMSVTEYEALGGVIAVQINEARGAVDTLENYLAGQQGQQNANTGVGGIVKNITIPAGTADGAALSATDFASTGPTSGDLLVRAVGQSRYIGPKAANGAGNYFAILNYTFTTDNHSLAAVLGPATAANSYTTLYTHSDTSFTVGAYCRIYPDHIEVGSYTRSGSTYTYTPFSGGTWTGPVPSGTPEFRNVGTTWTVWIGGVQTVIVVNSSVTFSAARRRAAVSVARQVVSGFSGLWDGFWISSIIMSDFVVPAYPGSGAKMSRVSATKMNAANTLTHGDGTDVMPTNYYDTTVAQSADVTVDPVNAKFTVSIDGWYKMDLRVPIGVTTTSLTAKYYPVLYKNGALYEWGPQVIPGHDGSTATWPTGFSATWAGPLKVNDTVQAAYSLDMPVTNFFGEGDFASQQSVFSIALTSRSLN